MPSPARKTAAPAAPDPELKAVEIDIRSAERAGRLSATPVLDPVSARFAVFDTAEPRDAAQDALDTFLDAGRSKPSPAQRITGHQALEILAKFDRLAPASDREALSAEERRLIAAFEIPADQPGPRPNIDNLDDQDKEALAQTILRVGQRWNGRS